MRLFSSANSKVLAISALVLAAALGPGSAFATLGEPELTVQNDAALSRASVKSQDRSSYRVHEMLLPSGTLLREFVGANGNVFAVAWQGPTKPNLRQALGRYFDLYVAAPRSKFVDRKHMRIQQGDLIIEGSGHMRALSGRAFLMSAIPSGVDLGEVQ